MKSSCERNWTQDTLLSRCSRCSPLLGRIRLMPCLPVMRTPRTCKMRRLLWQMPRWKPCVPARSSHVSGLTVSKMFVGKLWTILAQFLHVTHDCRGMVTDLV